MKDFLAYFERYWIREKNSENGRNLPLFGFRLWNKHEQALNMLPTTNNGVEGWNSNWNSTCSRRPNWWSYLTHLQMEEGLSCMRWREMRDGTYKDPNPGRSARRKAKQELIKSILDQFVEDKDLDSFFTSLLYKI